MNHLLKRHHCIFCSLKIKSFFSLLLLFISLQPGCVERPRGVETSGVSDKTNNDTLFLGKGSTTPYIKGTFITFSGKDNWDQDHWEAHMKEMQEVGL